MSGPAGNIAHVHQAVLDAGGQLVIRDGRLQARGWQLLSTELQATIRRRCYELIAYMVNDAQYTLSDLDVERLRRWVATGELETIGDEIVPMPGTRIPPGEAGAAAAYWLRLYDPASRYNPAERHLRGIYYCALVYWQQRARSMG